MQIVAILIGVFIAAGVGWYISRPLLQAKRMSTTDEPVQSMEVQRDSLYAQISELELDHATGKTNDEDYQQVRTGLVTQAANVLREIDGQSPSAKTQDADIEALIAARRKTTVKPAGKADLDQQIEAAIKARRSGIVCPNCGKLATADDVFCSRCGTSLKIPQKV
ncbi:MAG TPA: zinc ribbon domain-containing protein [Anaerolineae bacterium]|nr:zinc ribbon domain-containing protein [Anaerolineae bacterium]